MLMVLFAVHHKDEKVYTYFRCTVWLDLTYRILSRQVQLNVLLIVQLIIICNTLIAVLVG